MIQAFMDKLAKEMDVDTSFETSIQGVYTLPIDENIHIKITEVPPGFSLQCQICHCPSKGEEIFFTSLLLGNLFGKATQGAVLGLSEDGKLVMLLMDIDYTVEYKEFRDKLEDFINAIDFWREEANTAEKNAA